MQQTQYRFIHSGLYSELAALSAAETVDHLRNYLGNFLLDGVVASAYLNRLVQDYGSPECKPHLPWVQYLLKKIIQLQPFNEQARQVRAQMVGQPDECMKYLERSRLPQSIQDKLSRQSAQDPRLRRSILKELLNRFAYCPTLIEMLLILDLEEGISPGQGWLDHCRVPLKLQPLLDGQVMMYCLLQGDLERARRHLEASRGRVENEGWLNTAAEVLVRTGDRQRATVCYRKSLQQDPLQIPVRYRLAELEYPLKADPGSLTAQASIFLYSYNKSELLQQTLSNLAVTELGNAEIVVLLNNCTDDSREAVLAINRELFDGHIEVVNLPVNIGAPAARNWLLSTEQAKKSEYVAFLDDDVEVPRDWLARLLTVLQNEPKAGVAGAKTLAPGRPRRLQYLYRNVAIARQDLLRISLDTPNFNYDSGVYDFVRPTTNVMGCCHVFTRQALDAVPEFDIRFSPSQMDDIAHDLDLCLKGFKVMYCGLVECVHHQMSGMGRETAQDLVRYGNVLGNDVKFYYRFLPEIDGLRRMNNLADVPETPEKSVLNWGG